MTMQQTLSNVKWAHIPSTIYLMTTNFNHLGVWKDLGQIYSLHVALGSDKLKVQMPGWRHTLNHLLMLLLYSDTLTLWERFYISRKSWRRMTGLMRKYKIATSHAQTKGHFNLGFLFFDITYEVLVLPL